MPVFEIEQFFGGLHWTEFDTHVALRAACDCYLNIFFFMGVTGIDEVGKLKRLWWTLYAQCAHVTVACNNRRRACSPARNSLLLPCCFSWSFLR